MRLGLNLFIAYCIVLVYMSAFVSEPITTLLGGPDMYINKGSTMNLTCIVKHSPEPPPAIYWTHDSEVGLKIIF